MQKFVVDASLPEKLRGVMQTVLLCDEAGEVMGKYVPEMARFEPPPMSREELRRRIDESGGRTLAEILAGLEK